MLAQPVGAAVPPDAHERFPDSTVRVPWRPWGWQGPTPLAVREERNPIGEEERRLFLPSYEEYARHERGVRHIDPQVELDHWQQASIDRVAISRALVEHGYLEFRRRQVAPPIIRKKAVNIS